MGILDWFKPKASRPTLTWDVKVPEGLKLYTFQERGAQWLCGRSRALLADEPGLGKTIQVAAAINTLNIHPVLIVCPATIKLTE